MPYDRFRDRVMFPITESRGRVIAFGGRALEKDVAAKYLNSPETPLFHKGDNLYNLAPRGRPRITAARWWWSKAMSTSSPWSAPALPASVAPLGTALTENQLALLWKMADEPILCFDGDKAGQKAAWRAADLALPHLKPGKSLRFALLPEGQDPDDLARSRRPRRDRGSDLGGARARRRDLVARDRRRHVCDARAARGAGGADRRTRPTASATTWCGAIIARISANGCSEALRRKSRAAATARAIIAPERAISAANQAGVLPRAARSPRALRAGFESRGRGQASPGSQTINRGPYQAASPQLALSPIMRGQRSALSRREALILQTLINHPWLLHDHLEEVAALELAHPEANKLRAGIIAAFANDHHQSREPREQAEKMRADLEAARIFANSSKG